MRPLQVQQTVREVVATDGALLMLLLETTIVRLLRAAQRDDTDTALYAYLLKQILKVTMAQQEMPGTEAFAAPACSFCTCSSPFPIAPAKIARA